MSRREVESETFTSDWGPKINYDAKVGAKLRQAHSYFRLPLVPL